MLQMKENGFGLPGQSQVLRFGVLQQVIQQVSQE